MSAVVPTPTTVFTPNFDLDVRNLNDKGKIIGKQNVAFGSDDNQILIGKTPDGSSRFVVEFDKTNPNNDAYLIFDNKDGTLDELAGLATDAEKLADGKYKYPIKNVTVGQSGNLVFTLNNEGTERKLKKVEITANKVTIGIGEDKEVVYNYGTELLDVTLPKNFVDLFLSRKYTTAKQSNLPRQIFRTLENNKDYFGLTDDNFLTLNNIEGKPVLKILKIPSEIKDGKQKYEYYTMTGTEMLRIEHPVYYISNDKADICVGFRLYKGSTTIGQAGIRAEDMAETDLQETRKFFELDGRDNNKLWNSYRDKNPTYSGETAKPGEASVDGKDKYKYADLPKEKEPIIQPPQEQLPQEQQAQELQPPQEPQPQPPKPPVAGRRKKWGRIFKYLMLAILFLAGAALTGVTAFYGAIWPIVAFSTLTIGVGGVLTGEITEDIKDDVKRRLKTKTAQAKASATRSKEVTAEHTVEHTVKQEADKSSEVGRDGPNEGRSDELGKSEIENGKEASEIPVLDPSLEIKEEPKEEADKKDDIEAKPLSDSETVVEETVLKESERLSPEAKEREERRKKLLEQENARQAAINNQPIAPQTGTNVANSSRIINSEGNATIQTGNTPQQEIVRPAVKKGVPPVVGKKAPPIAPPTPTQDDNTTHQPIQPPPPINPVDKGNDNDGRDNGL